MVCPKIRPVHLVQLDPSDYLDTKGNEANVEAKEPKANRVGPVVMGIREMKDQKVSRDFKVIWALPEKKERQAKMELGRPKDLQDQKERVAHLVWKETKDYLANVVMTVLQAAQVSKVRPAKRDNQEKTALRGCQAKMVDQDKTPNTAHVRNAEAVLMKEVVQVEPETVLAHQTGQAQVVVLNMTQLQAAIQSLKQEKTPLHLVDQPNQLLKPLPEELSPSPAQLPNHRPVMEKALPLSPKPPKLQLNLPVEQEANLVIIKPLLHAVLPPTRS